MTKNRTSLVFLTLLAGAYAYFFTDWFHPRRIQISAQVRPARAGQSAVAFRLDGEFKLTEVAVYSLDALATNDRAGPVWHVVTASNAPPVSYFSYGGGIPGLKPAADKPSPDWLRPNAAYRLLVRAGRAKGELDFRAPQLFSP